MQLGYAGYPEFQRALEEMVMNRLNSVQRMQFTYGRVPQGEILETVLQSDIEKIKMTLEEVDRSAFERAADTILSARTIYIVGIRSCAPLASFLAYDEGTGICEQPQSEGDYDHRQCAFTDECLCSLYADCQERYGIDR